MEEIARQPKVKLLWNGKDIYDDISRFVSSVNYTDNEEESSDEISIVLDDSEHLWSGDWYPTEGDTIELYMGYSDKLVNCGLFQVDEITLSGKPDQIEIKAIAAGITKALRSRNNKAFEEQTLKQIAQYFCTKHGFKLIDETIISHVTKTYLSESYLLDYCKDRILARRQTRTFVLGTLQGLSTSLSNIASTIQNDYASESGRILKFNDILATALPDANIITDMVFFRMVNEYCIDLDKIVDTIKLPPHVVSSSLLSQINLDRKTQEEKTDLAFLSEIATEYGFIFSIRGNNMVFTSYYILDNADSIKSIDKNRLSSYSIKEKTYDTYASGKISSRNATQSHVTDWSEEWGGGKYKTDILLVNGKVSNKQQAEAKVKGGLWNKNKFKQSGNINDMPGDPELVSGINFDLTGCGNLSGKYHITVSTHSISGGAAYTTSLEIRKTGTILKPKQVPKVSKEQDSQYQENVNDYEENADETK